MAKRSLHEKPSQGSKRWRRLRSQFDRFSEEFEPLTPSQHCRVDHHLLVPLTAMMWHVRTVLAAFRAGEAVGGARSAEELLAGLKQFYLEYFDAKN